MTSLDCINGPVDSDVADGVITTRSNRMKFKLGFGGKDSNETRTQTDLIAYFFENQQIDKPST